MPWKHVILEEPRKDLVGTRGTRGGKTRRNTRDVRRELARPHGKSRELRRALVGARGNARKLTRVCRENSRGHSLETYGILVVPRRISRDPVWFFVSQDAEWEPVGSVGSIKIPWAFPRDPTRPMGFPRDAVGSHDTPTGSNGGFRGNFHGSW